MATTTKKKTAKRKVKAGGARRTGDRVSRIAAKVLRAVRYREEIGDSAGTRATFLGGMSITLGDLKALAASCLAQDEHRGARRE
jgi:hypothetical protein